MTATATASLEIDHPGFHALFEEVAQVGRTEAGGLYRLAASAEEGLARDIVCRWLRERGFGIRIDPVGNVFALLEFAGPEASWVLSGSHLDSQPRGGRYDGAYGVIAACLAADAIRRLAPAVRTRNLAVVIWTNEEGARFAPSMMGSGVYAGHYTADYALSRTDAGGVSVKEALGAIGYHGLEQGPATPVACVELHIEQGPELEASGTAIGVVEGNWGTMKYIVTMNGVAAHTGPTPMAERHDALLASAYLVAACRELSDRTGGRLLTSVGRLDVEPNSSNVVAQQVKVYAEMRATDNELLAANCSAFEAAAASAAQRAFVTADVVQVTNRPAGDFDAGLCALIEQAAKDKELNHRRLHTVAGHDAVSLRKRCPAAMIFVPSVKGISHNEAEFTQPQDLANGLEILGAVLLRLVQGHPLSTSQP
jgi:beta-ureidopropionase / N-carbamoyl-L-amino-acid hydrolase